MLSPLMQANVTSSTTERKSRCYVLEKKGRLYLKHNVFTKDIPICIAFRCMGVESDQEIMALVDSSPLLHSRSATSRSIAPTSTSVSRRRTRRASSRRSRRCGGWEPS